MALSQTFVAKTKDSGDPIAVFKFWVKLEGQVAAEFKECSGLRLERTVETIQEGGLNDRVHYLPGQTKQATITLKYGVMNTHELWQWYQQVLSNGKVERTTISIVLHDVTGKVAKTWSLEGAFPTKWEAPSFNVETSQVAIETLEIAFNNVTLS